MYETPGPTHGYFWVTMAFWAYIALAGGVAFGARWIGVSTHGTVIVFLLAALGLLKLFLPLFRRLHPTTRQET